MPKKEEAAVEAEAPANPVVLLQQNQELLEEIYLLTKKNNQHLLWNSIGGWLKFILIMLSLALSFVFLKPLLGIGSTGLQSIINPAGTLEQQLQQGTGQK